jgi:hypothetical protein
LLPLRPSNACMSYWASGRTRRVRGCTGLITAGDNDKSGFAAMNAEFFALAFTAAANPNLLAIDLLLIENKRPRAMFAGVLAGGMSIAIAVGLVDVLVVQAHLVNSQKKVSAGVYLALGVVLLVLGALLLTGNVPRRRRANASPAGAERKNGKSKGNGWAQRILREPRPMLAFAVGALVGLPGGVYLAALHGLIIGHYSTVTQVVAVFVFVIIEFLLIIIPWSLLELWPEAIGAFLRRAQAWLVGHGKQLIAWICVLLGTYLTISALVQLL